MYQIHFGTSGWRDIMADGFTFERVAALTRAVARHLKSQGLGQQGVLVGHDYRFLAEDFALFTAKVLSSEGVRVHIADEAAPTPALSVAIRELKLAGGINFTASHNPALYQGFKWSNAHGGPATKEEIAPIERLANQLLESGAANGAPAGLSPAPLVTYSPKSAYFRALAKIVPFKILRAAKLKVVADPLFGAGRGYLAETLIKAGCRVKVLHDCRDVLFGGHNPEPDAANLKEAAGVMKQTKACLVLGTDGDADRFGVVDANGKFLTPNQILALTIYLLVHHRGWKGRVVRSVVTSHLVDAVAGLYQLPVEITPVGFKYIGESMLRGGFLAGGEESGGLTIASHVPEKDGVLACLLMAELVAREKCSLSEILKKLYRRIGRTILSDRINVQLESAAAGERLRETLNQKQPERLGGHKVVRRDTTDGFKYELDDHTWLAIRLSGTEPVARVYLEAADAAGLKRLGAAGRELLAGGL
jgi:alpha-D-glucose phosphate-specific phosphoglucomutase